MSGRSQEMLFLYARVLRAALRIQGAFPRPLLRRPLFKEESIGCRSLGAFFKSLSQR